MLLDSHLASSAKGTDPGRKNRPYNIDFSKDCILVDLKSWFRSLLKWLVGVSLPFSDSGIPVTACHTHREGVPFPYNRLLHTQRVFLPPSLFISPLSSPCRPGPDSVSCCPDGSRKGTQGRVELPGEDDLRHLDLVPEAEYWSSVWPLSLWKGILGALVLQHTLLEMGSAQGAANCNQYLRYSAELGADQIPCQFFPPSVSPWWRAAYRSPPSSNLIVCNQTFFRSLSSPFQRVYLRQGPAWPDRQCLKAQKPHKSDTKGTAMSDSPGTKCTCGCSWVLHILALLKNCVQARLSLIRSSQMDTINQLENPGPNSALRLIQTAPFNVTNGICAKWSPEQNLAFHVCLD